MRTILTAITMLAIGWTAPALGQELQIESGSHQLSVVNELGQWARVKMIRYGNGNFLSVDMPSGAKYDNAFYAGQRFVVAWDRNQNIILFASINVNKSGTVRLRNVLPAMRRESGSGAPRTVEQAIPEIQVE